MREDFCAFILTHGRPDKVHTIGTLRKAGYTGKVYIVIDDEDETEPEYRRRFGEKVLQFSKAEAAICTDDGDNSGDRRVVVYARNACWRLAENIGCRYFWMLDDDYTGFYWRFRHNAPFQAPVRKMDNVLTVLLDYYESIPARIIAIAQGGDFIGGTAGNANCLHLSRKVMNTFICSVDRPVMFLGRINEDANTYIEGSRRGELFLTTNQLYVSQETTQLQDKGLSEYYREYGTYTKSFYSVMYAPSGVKISYLEGNKNPHARFHHKLNWHAIAPKILREEWRKATLVERDGENVDA